MDDVRRWKPGLEDSARAQDSSAATRATQLVRAAEQSIHEPVLGLALWVAGNVALLLSQPSQALTYYQRAEHLFGKQQDALSAARMCVGKVEALCDLGIYDEAIRAGEAAIPVLQSRQDDSDQQRLASLLDALGANYERLGWLVEALANSERAQHWWHTHAGPSTKIPAARAQINAAVVKTLLGQYIEAQQDFLGARATLSEAAGDPAALADVARIDMNLAWLEVVRRNTSDIVERAFAQAQVSRSHIDPALDSVDFAFFDLLQAEWRLSAAAPTPFIEQELLELARRCEDAGLVYEPARAAIQLARAALNRGDVAAAQQLCIQQLEAALQRGDVEVMHMAGLALAQAQLAAGQTEVAELELEQVIQRAEATRSRFASDEFRAGYLDDKLAAYQLLAAISLNTARPARAFAVMEQAKARTLAESLGAIAVKASQTRANENVDGDVNAVVDVAAQLQPDEMMISYAWINDQMWAFLISQAGLTKVVALGLGLSSDQLRNDLARISSIARLPVAQAERFAAQHMRSAQAVLGRWHQQFFEPLYAAVAPYQKLIVCPDQLLGLIPFASLYHAPSGRYLVEDHDVVMAPSASIWANIRVSTEAQDQTRPRACLVAGLSSGGRLTHAIVEAKSVAKHLAEAGHTVQLLLEADATLEALVQNILTPDLIYVASHGTYRPDAPARSFIEFSDRNLTTDEIARLKLQASAVVLSACETGVGHLSGNELMGFVRAFLYAGAQSVIATHWPVDDVAMNTLMGHFVKNLMEHPSLATAFCTAQRALIHQSKPVRMDVQSGMTMSRFAHPYYWGALSVVGRC